MTYRIAATFAALAFMLTGCSPIANLEPRNPDTGDSHNNFEQSEEFPQAEADDSIEQQRAEDLAAAPWRCYWNPTINDDWHDDYECTNGTAHDRPYLLTDDSFVERWELESAASEYADILNQ